MNDIKDIYDIVITTRDPKLRSISGYSTHIGATTARNLPLGNDLVVGEAKF